MNNTKCPFLSGNERTNICNLYAHMETCIGDTKCDVGKSFKKVSEIEPEMKRLREEINEKNRYQLELEEKVDNLLHLIVYSHVDILESSYISQNGEIKTLNFTVNGDSYKYEIKEQTAKISFKDIKRTKN